MAPLPSSATIHFHSISWYKIISKNGLLFSNVKHYVIIFFHSKNPSGPFYAKIIFIEAESWWSIKNVIFVQNEEKGRGKGRAKMKKFKYLNLANFVFKILPDLCEIIQEKEESWNNFDLWNVKIHFKLCIDFNQTILTRRSFLLVCPSG